jgi:hypothetical protein
MSGFKRATKAAAKLRAAIFGPSGAGKTYTSLRLAKGIGGRMAVIDTEGVRVTKADGTVDEMPSAAKYSDRFDFDVQVLEDKSIEGYTAAIREAGELGYEVLVIDSLSHCWQWLTEEVEKIAKLRYRGNTWSAWSEGTPMQRELLQAILAFPGHVVVTMRSRTDWSTGDANGKKVPNRVGLAPEQGKGIEYEFDLLVELSVDHIANVIKDRTGKFQDKMIDKPGEDFGRQLAAWLNEGTRPAALPASGAVASGGVATAPEAVPANHADSGPVGESTRPATAALAAAQAQPRADLEQIVGYIRAAATVRTLGRMGDRIDEMSSDGQVSAAEAEWLHKLIDERHRELEPQPVADAFAE